MIIGTPVAFIDLTEEELASVNVQRLESIGCGADTCEDCGGDSTPEVCYEFEMLTIFGHDGDGDPLVNRLTVRMDTEHAAALCASMVTALTESDPAAWAYAIDFREKNGSHQHEHFRMTRGGKVVPVEEDPDAG